MGYILRHEATICRLKMLVCLSWWIRCRHPAEGTTQPSSERSDIRVGGRRGGSGCPLKVGLSFTGSAASRLQLLDNSQLAGLLGGCTIDVRLLF